MDLKVFGFYSACRRDALNTAVFVVLVGLSRNRQRYTVKEWPAREELIPGKDNVMKENISN